MEHASRGVHHHVQYAAFGFKLVHVDDPRVGVGVEKQELGVRSKIEDARVGVETHGMELEIVGCQGNQGVGRGKNFDDHLRDFSIRRKVPSCTNCCSG